ncbi:MAG: DUF2515 family protein, partial [Myxococcota bacterium]
PQATSMQDDAELVQISRSDDAEGFFSGVKKEYGMGGEHNLIDRIERRAREMNSAEIAATDDPIFRNYLITQRYWRLSEAMMDLIGRRDLVWPAFGAWASAQAGRHMRLESPAFARFAPRPLRRRIRDMLGRGNQLVFSDIAPPFEQFIDFARTRRGLELAECAPAEPDQIAASIRDELGLDPRPISEHDEGQRLMIVAFSQYFMALHEQNPDSRAERIYVANCCVGLQEQTRIDCMLDALLDVDAANDVAPWLAIPVALTWWSTGPLRWLTKLIATTGLGPIERLAQSVRRAERSARVWESCLLEDRFSQVLGTRLFMHFQLNGEELDIDADVPWASADAIFPDELAEFDTTCPQFRAYLDEVLRWDRTPDTTEDSAAMDWTELGDRMNFILDLFRTRQQDEQLAINPLTIE